MERRTFLRGALTAAGAVGLSGLLAQQAVRAQAATRSTIALVGDTSGGGLYHPNLAPLAQTPLLRLPVGSVKPAGWLREQLSLQLAGLNGQMDTVSHFLDLSTTGWAVPSEVGWEEVPYWLRGYVDLGAITGDAHTVATTAKWIDAILATQASDGFFGPTALRTSLGGGPDFWPYMPMMQVMRSYQEATGDPRIVPFMTAFYRFQSQQSASAFNQSCVVPVGHQPRLPVVALQPHRRLVPAHPRRHHPRERSGLRRQPTDAAQRQPRPGVHRTRPVLAPQRRQCPAPVHLPGLSADHGKLRPVRRRWVRR